MRNILYLIISIILFNCGSSKELKIEEESKINYIKEIYTYSNFKNFLNRDLKRQSSKDTFSFGKNKTKGLVEVHKYYYPKIKELVYIQYLKNNDSTIIENYFYRKNELVRIECTITTPNKDTLFQDIYLKEKKVIFEKKSSLTSKKIIDKGLNYITNFNFEE